MNPARLNNFDFLRLALASAVIFSHSYDLLGHANPFKRATGDQTELASMAVDGFFILSGFLITQSFVSSRRILDYFRNRVLRIFPAFIVGGLICLLVFAPLPMGFAREYWSDVEPGRFWFRLITLQTLWIPQAFHANHWPYVNSAIWTIQYEFLCYLALAALGVAGLLRRRKAMVALFIAAGVLNVLHAAYAPVLLTRFPTNPLFTYADLAVGGSPAWYPRFLTYFLAGSVFFLYRDRIALTLPRALVAAGALFLALFLYRGYNVVMPVAGTYLAFWFAFNREIPVSGAGKYGDFSYGLYVYGWPVQQTVIWLFGGRIAPLPLFVLSLAGALALGVLSWKVIERPFMKLKALSASPRRSAPFPAVLGVAYRFVRHSEKRSSAHV